MAVLTLLAALLFSCAGGFGPEQKVDFIIQVDREKKKAKSPGDGPW